MKGTGWMTVAFLMLLLTGCASFGEAMARQLLMDHDTRERFLPLLQQGLHRKLQEETRPLSAPLPAPFWLDRG
jgi:hypothetical protein